MSKSEFLSGLSGLSDWPTEEQERKIAWRIAWIAKNKGISLILAVGGALNSGIHGNGILPGKKDYWRSITGWNKGITGRAAAVRVDNRWKRLFPDVYNSNPPRKYPVKSKPKPKPKPKKTSGSHHSSGSSPKKTSGSDAEGSTPAPAAPRKSGFGGLSMWVMIAALGGGGWWVWQDYTSHKKKKK
jgi:hypothetical protein